MLSMLGWQTPAPFGKKAQLEAQKQYNMPFLPRTKTTESQARVAQAGPTYYVISSSGSYMPNSQRPSHGHAGRPAAKAPSGYPQPAPPHNGSAPAAPARPDFKTSASGQQIPPTSGSPGGSYKIYPNTTMPDSFIYERSEDADSDTLTIYANSSADTLQQFPSTDPSSHAPPPSTTRRNSSMLIMSSSNTATYGGVQPAPESPHVPHISLPSTSSTFAVTSQGRSPPRGGEDVSRPRSGSGDSGSSRRRSSGSDSERPVVPPAGPSPARSSPPPRSTPSVRFPDRESVPLTITQGSRDVSPPVRRHSDPSRESDPSMQVDAPRKRRLSGAVIPTGFGVLPGERLSPTNGRNSVAVVPAGPGTAGRHSPPVLRGAPAPDGKRERFSPDREISVTGELARERRVNVAGPDGFPPPPPGSFYDRDRPPLRRGSQSSGSSSSRERHSPQDEAPRGAGFAPGPVLMIRSRTLSKGRIGKDDVPKPIFVAGLESSKMVRFSETLICPSPIPLEKRRRGWYNKRGDQLWTNDGIFVAPEPGTEYPIELNEYPEPGVGWQNEEGIRIDMQHRLIPKAPLRPALKRGGSSGNQQQQLHQQANRTNFSTTIREEA